MKAFMSSAASREQEANSTAKRFTRGRLQGSALVEAQRILAECEHAPGKGCYASLANLKRASRIPGKGWQSARDARASLTRSLASFIGEE